jgi:hypothetical protein
MLIAELDKRIQLNPLYFSGFKDGQKWRIKELEEAIDDCVYDM